MQTSENALSQAKHCRKLPAAAPLALGSLLRDRQTGSLRSVRKLVHRPRRLRRSPALRNLVRETNITAHDLVLPLFVSEKISKRTAITSMPGVSQFTIK